MCIHGIAENAFIREDTYSKRDAFFATADLLTHVAVILKVMRGGSASGNGYRFTEICGLCADKASEEVFDNWRGFHGNSYTPCTRRPTCSRRSQRRMPRHPTFSHSKPHGRDDTSASPSRHCQHRKPSSLGRRSHRSRSLVVEEDVVGLNARFTA